MTDFLQMAEEMVPKLIPRRTVRYQRGNYWVALSATVGRTLIEYVDNYGVKVTAEQRDYLIEPALLILNSVQVEPQDGDTIVDTGEGATRTYVVASHAGDKSWRYTDRYHMMLRVHVKEISSE